MGHYAGKANETLRRARPSVGLRRCQRPDGPCDAASSSESTSTIPSGDDEGRPVAELSRPRQPETRRYQQRGRGHRLEGGLRGWYPALSSSGRAATGVTRFLVGYY